VSRTRVSGTLYVPSLQH